MKHFRPESVTSYDLDVLTPDDFLVHQFHFNKELLREKLAAQGPRVLLRSTPYSIDSSVRHRIA